MLKQIILVWAIISSINCNSLLNKEKKIKKLTHEEVIVNIPLNNAGDTSLFYKTKTKLADELKLESLEKGYNSLQIRIWLGYGTLIKQQLIIIKQEENNWSGNIIVMTMKEDSKNDQQLIAKKTIKKVTPRSGWENLIKKLTELNIFTLPNCDDIKGMNTAGGDLNVYKFEIATPKLYRFYYYIQPDLYVDEFIEARKVEEILKVLEIELNFKMLQNK